MNDRGRGLPPGQTPGHFAVRHTLRKRFRTACKCLGRERLESLTIYHGGSHSSAMPWRVSGRQNAAGHANVSITSAYLHVAVDDDTVGELFRF
jgi:hypothetical protein